MSQQLDREALDQILQAEDVERLSLPELINLFQAEEAIADALPDGTWQIDPRNGDRVLFSSSRARRPHDNLPPPDGPRAHQACAVCQGNTTGVVDVADLSQGFTFINKNLYPILYPMEANRSRRLRRQVGQGPQSGGCVSYGLHFLQWTSSHHDRDWHNMPLADRVIVMQRLAALERKLLAQPWRLSPPSEPCGDWPCDRGLVLIIKNCGHLVGGSLAHGHQQIALSNIAPRRVCDNWRFEQQWGETFSTYLMRENPAEFLIRDYGSAVLLVPYFMRRPYDMVLVVRDVSKNHLHKLTETEIAAVAEGWHDAIRAIRLIMPQIGTETAYNVITHNGPGAGLYFEFLPYVQQTGGFEHLGLWISQGNPRSAAARIRECLKLPPPQGVTPGGERCTSRS
jgi:galactose-1-phosphate uridylyltransferase